MDLLAFQRCAPWLDILRHIYGSRYILSGLYPAAQQGNSLCGTARDAMQAMGALFAVPENLPALRKLAFRISAPAAAERQPLKKTVVRDARPVIDAEFLDVENNAGKVRIFRHDYPLFFLLILPCRHVICKKNIYEMK